MYVTAFKRELFFDFVWAFLIKQLFHSRFVGYKIVIANSPTPRWLSTISYPNYLITRSTVQFKYMTYLIETRRIEACFAIYFHESLEVVIFISRSMSRSPVSNLGELWRKDASVTIVGMQRPRSPKTTERRFTFAGGKNEDWNTVSNAVTALFQRKKLANKELNNLTEKVKNVKKEIGNHVICDLFKESILMKGMIILREDVKAKNGEVLLDKLADSWTYFFSNILPLVQAIFLNVQPPDGQSIRDISLLSFRDTVVLKTKLEEAFIMGLTAPPKLVQMLLVLQVSSSYSHGSF